MTRTKNIITEIEITNNINILTYSKLICNTTSSGPTTSSLSIIQLGL